MEDFLLIHGCVVTQNPQRRVIEDGVVGVRGGRITRVEPYRDGMELAAKERLDCTGKLVLSGLIDGHGHAGHPMTKLLSCDSIQHWGSCVERVYFYASTPEFWYYDALLSAMERVRFGVTSGMSVIANEPRADSIEIVQSHARGYAEVGACTVMGVGPGSNHWPKPSAQWDGQAFRSVSITWEEAMSNTQSLLAGLHMGRGGMQRLFVTPFTIVPSLPTWGRSMPETASRLTAFDQRQMRAVKQLAKQYGTGIHSDAFGNGIALMAQADEPLLGPNVLLQHCYDLNWREVELVAQTGTHIGHSPEQSSRFCPYTELLQAGANVAITSDGNGPRVTFDMFEHMRRAQDLEMMRFGDFYALDAQSLLDGVTTRAARALGMEAETGSLEAGKRADIILLDGTAPHLQGSRPAVEKCVYAASGLDVEWVMANGRVLLKQGAHCGLREGAVLQEAGRVAMEAIEAAGLGAFARQQPVFGTPYQHFLAEPAVSLPPRGATPTTGGTA